jgi:hypothetical protein
MGELFMGAVPSIVFGLPFCQNTKGDQTKLSIGLRVTAIALGTIAMIVSILMLCSIPGLSQLGTTAGWIIFTIGAGLALLGIAIKCVKETSLNVVKDAKPLPKMPPKPSQHRPKNCLLSQHAKKCLNGLIKTEVN